MEKGRAFGSLLRRPSFWTGCLDVGLLGFPSGGGREGEAQTIEQKDVSACEHPEPSDDLELRNEISEPRKVS